MASHEVQMEKDAARVLTEKSRNKQTDRIINRVLASGRGNRGWSCAVTKRLRNPTPSGYTYILMFNVSCTRDEKESEFESILHILAKAGNASEWRVTSVDGKPYKTDKKPSSATIGYAHVEIPNDWENHFREIFDRDEQINIIKSSIEAAITSDWKNRFHCCLLGEPASGKTEILHSLKSALGQHAVLEYDATNTTQAGAIKDISVRDELPRVLLVEEIEKVEENSIRWLLSVMDHRAEIRKTNYREQVVRETRCLCIATANDYTLFKKIMFGALASRFAWHLYTPVPGRDCLVKILSREIAKVKGKNSWIKPTLDFAGELNITDPRKIIAVCLCGRDRLISGEYQKTMRLCFKHEQEFQGVKK